jgi:hypothetical protein
MVWVTSSFFAPIFHTGNASDSPAVLAKILYQTPGYSESYGSFRSVVFAGVSHEISTVWMKRLRNDSTEIAMATFTTLLRRGEP